MKASNWKHSFTRRLSRHVVRFAAILFFICFVVLAVSSHIIISREATKSAENILHSAVSDIDLMVQQVEGAVKNASWLVGEHMKDEAYLYHITRKLVEENENIVGSAIAFRQGYFKGRKFFSPYSYQEDGTGGLLSKQLGNDDYDYFGMEWFSVPYETGGEHWSEPYMDEGGGGVLMSTYSLPLKDEAGNVIAVITADLSLRNMYDIVTSIKPYPNSYLFVSTSKGAFISGNASSMAIGETTFSVARKMGNRDFYDICVAIAAGESGVRRYTLGREISFIVFGPMSNGWAASMNCRYSDILKSTTRIHIIILLIFILGMITLFLLCFFTIRKLTKPLSVISDSAMKIAGGDFDSPLPEIESDDEIGQLRDSFDTMQRSLNDYMSNLKVATAAKERIESELFIAHALQMSMLPQNFPPREMVDLHAVLVPAKEVGGDFYDFELGPDGDLFVAVGDVSGKGVPAALVMSITKSAFRLLDGMGLSVSGLVQRVNDKFTADNATGMFVTLFLAKIDLKTGKMQFCNAGHNPVVIISPESGDAHFLEEKSNIAVGVFEGFPYEMQEIVLAKGTKLLLYTDGVTEAERGDKAQFGEERLLEWATRAACAGEDCRTACDALMSEISSFTEGAEQNDDITIMTISI